MRLHARTVQLGHCRDRLHGRRQRVHRGASFERSAGSSRCRPRARAARQSEGAADRAAPPTRRWTTPAIETKASACALRAASIPMSDPSLCPATITRENRLSARSCATHETASSTSCRSGGPILQRRRPWRSRRDRACRSAATRCPRRPAIPPASYASCSCRAAGLNCRFDPSAPIRDDQNDRDSVRPPGTTSAPRIVPVDVAISTCSVRGARSGRATLLPAESRQISIERSASRRGHRGLLAFAAASIRGVGRHTPARPNPGAAGSNRQIGGSMKLALMSVALLSMAGTAAAQALPQPSRHIVGDRILGEHAD